MMTICRSVLILLFWGVLVGCKPDNTPKMTSLVSLSSLINNADGTYTLQPQQPRGIARFTQESDHVLVEISLTGFPPNTMHAVHLHTGTCENPGMHWNAAFDHTQKLCSVKSLGVAWAKPYAGDIGNVSVGYDGSGAFTMRTDLWTLGSGTSNDIAGTVVVVHQTYTDFNDECDPSHDHTHPHENPKVACGMVEGPSHSGSHH